MEAILERLVLEHLEWAARQPRQRADALSGAFEGAVALGAVGDEPPLTLVTGPCGSGKGRHLAERLQGLIAHGWDPSLTLRLDLSDGRLAAIPDRRLLSRAVEAYFEQVPAARSQPFCLMIENADRAAGWEEFVRALLDTYEVRLWASGPCASWTRPRFLEGLPPGTQVRRTLAPAAASALRRLMAAVPADGSDPVHQALERFCRVGRGALLDTTDDILAHLRLLARRAVCEDVARHLPHLPLALVERATVLLLGSSGQLVSLSAVQRRLEQEGLATTRAALARIACALEEAWLLQRIPEARPPEDGRTRAAQLLCALDQGMAQAHAEAPLAFEALATTLVGAQLREEGLAPQVRLWRPTQGRGRFLVVADEAPGAFVQALAVGDPRSAAGRPRLAAPFRRACEELLAETGLSSVTLLCPEATAVFPLEGGACEAVTLGEWQLERAGLGG